MHRNKARKLRYNNRITNICWINIGIKDAKLVWISCVFIHKFFQKRKKIDVRLSHNTRRSASSLTLWQWKFFDQPKNQKRDGLQGSNIRKGVSMVYEVLQVRELSPVDTLLILHNSVVKHQTPKRKNSQNRANTQINEDKAKDFTFK